MRTIQGRKSFGVLKDHCDWWQKTVKDLWAGESHTMPGAHSRILALYPKGFLVDFDSENIHMF